MRMYQAAIFLSVTYLLLAKASSSAQNAPSYQDAPVPGAQVSATLSKAIKPGARVGDVVRVRTTGDVILPDGTKLPRHTELIGDVASIGNDTVAIDLVTAIPPAGAALPIVARITAVGRTPWENASYDPYSAFHGGPLTVPVTYSGPGTESGQYSTPRGRSADAVGFSFGRQTVYTVGSQVLSPPDLGIQNGAVLHASMNTPRSGLQPSARIRSERPDHLLPLKTSRLVGTSTNSGRFKSADGKHVYLDSDIQMVVTIARR